MSDELQLIGQMIIDKRGEIALAVHQDRLADKEMPEQQKKDLLRMEQDIINVRADFIKLFGDALMAHQDVNKSVDKIARWGKETGAYIYSLGMPLDEALKDASFYRSYIWAAIQELAESKQMPLSTVFKVISVFDPLLDKAIYYFSLTYVQFHQKMLENAKSAFLELSVPVVPLIKGVGVLPLIGNIDTERSRLLMEKTLEQSVNLKLSYLIFDVSGVEIIDTMVADQLFKIIEALTLIGVKTIITGIRPEVAQTMVSLGLNLEGIKVKASLHQAFDELRNIYGI